MRANSQLALIGLISQICAEESVEWWLRGGWAVDFFLGRVTRDHHDIDVFVVDEGWGPLRSGPRALRDSWRIEAYGQFVIDTSRKQDEELQVVLLDLGPDGEVNSAGGPHKGWDPWPAGMLDGSYGQIGDLIVPIIGPESQIDIKEMFGRWRPDLPARDYDSTDIALIRNALAKDRGDCVNATAGFDH